MKFISTPESCPQNISYTLWSYTTTGIYDVDLIEASARRMINRIDDFNAQELVNSASAFSSFNYSDHIYFDKHQSIESKTAGCQAISSSNESYTNILICGSSQALPPPEHQCNTHIMTSTLPKDHVICPRYSFRAVCGLPLLSLLTKSTPQHI